MVCAVFSAFLLGLWGKQQKGCMSKDNLKALGQTFPEKFESSLNLPLPYFYSEDLSEKNKTTAMLEPLPQK